MITAADLRIGNVHEVVPLSIPRLGIQQITVDGKAFSTITGYGIHLVESGQMEFKPIPLTEEWLLKMGLTYRKPSSIEGQDMWAGMGYIYLGKECLFRGLPNRLHLVGYFNSQFTMVHEVQNIIYALTGTELTIKQ